MYHISCVRNVPEKENLVANSLSQDCIDARQELEDRLARLQVAYEDAQAALAQCQMGVATDPATFASLGSVTGLLALTYIGGVYWRRRFGPDEPDYPLDRWEKFWLVYLFLLLEPGLFLQLFRYSARY
jgi:hypothetical protein